MTTQAHPSSTWREGAGSGAVPPVAALRLVLISPGVYALTDSGAPAGAIVDHGTGQFACTDTTTSGDASALRVGTAMGVIY